MFGTAAHKHIDRVAGLNNCPESAIMESAVTISRARAVAEISCFILRRNVEIGDEENLNSVTIT